VEFDIKTPRLYVLAGILNWSKGVRAELAKISAPHPLISAHRLKEKKIYEKVKLMRNRNSEKD
jgi:hypothetical protein